MTDFFALSDRAKDLRETLNLFLPYEEAREYGGAAQYLTGSRYV